MWGTRYLLGVVIALLGVCGGSLACNENRAVCKSLMNEAINMPTAQLQCNGMRQYLQCVRDDIADCPDNNYTDRYAVNMENNYCNRAYLCSDSLLNCYANFTQAVINTILRSDNETRVRLCGALVPPIMRCQEDVTSVCHDQTGLMETVDSKQFDLDVVCGDSMPCLNMILQCQSSFRNRETALSGDSAALQYHTQSGNCSSQQATIDYCQAYRHAMTCLRENMTSCRDQFSVDNVLATLENTTSVVCDPEVTCRRKVSSCLCHVNTQSQNPVAIMTSICSTYPPFARCVDGVDNECYSIPSISMQATSMKASYEANFNLFCTTQEGLCPPAVQCLGQAAMSASASSSSGSASRAPLDINGLCLVSSPVFRCLENASVQCERDSGGSDVTFSMIEERFVDMCLDIGPHVPALNECPGFAVCMLEFDLFRLGMTAANRGLGGQLEALTHMLAGLTDTDFWCSYLTHGFKCIADNAVTCLGEDLAAQAQQKYTDISTVCGGPTTTTTTTTERPAQPPPSRRPEGSGLGNTLPPAPSPRPPELTSPDAPKPNDNKNSQGGGDIKTHKASDGTGGSSSHCPHSAWLTTAAAATTLLVTLARL